MPRLPRIHLKCRNYIAAHEVDGKLSALFDLEATRGLMSTSWFFVDFDDCAGCVAIRNDYHPQKWFKLDGDSVRLDHRTFGSWATNEKWLVEHIDGESFHLKSKESGFYLIINDTGGFEMRHKPHARHAWVKQPVAEALQPELRSVSSPELWEHLAAAHLCAWLRGAPASGGPLGAPAPLSAGLQLGALGAPADDPAPDGAPPPEHQGPQALAAGDGASASFEVHSVAADPRLGAPVSVATVTAALSRGEDTERVLFVVFGGTDLISDFARWGPARDYAGCSPPDGESFVHAGCAQVMRNIKVLHAKVLLDRMARSCCDGTTRLVFCGHSTGGMYALAALRDFCFAPSEQEVQVSGDAAGALASATCVTFGSPMVFGRDGGGDATGAAFAAFKAYARERAVNYVLDTDPCPRAWSALDLRAFAAAAAGAMKDGLFRPESLVVYGGVVDQVVEHMLGEVLDAQVAAGQGFEHMGRLRLLSRSGAEREHWAEDAVAAAMLSRDGLASHGISSYICQLTNAGDPQFRLACRVYDENGNRIQDSCQAEVFEPRAISSGA